MAYTKTAWVDGSAPAISAANLGKIESALANSVGLDTLANLRALAVPTSIFTARTLGYTNDGDGGGGFWWWDASSSEADDGGTVIVPDSVPANGRWKRLYDGPLFPEWFGAKGDNTADDTAAFQSIADHNSELIELNHLSTYRVGVVTINRSKRISGNAATIKIISDTVFRVRTNIDNFVIDSVNFDVNGATGTIGKEAFNCFDHAAQPITAFPNGIQYDVKNLRITNCRFTAAKLTIGGANTDPWIQNCTWITDNTVSAAPAYLFIAKGDQDGDNGPCWVTENNFTVFPPSGSNEDIIKISGGVSNAIIANNVIKNFNTGCGAQIDVFTGAHKMRFVDNSLINVQFHLKQVIGSGVSAPSVHSYNAISGNVFELQDGYTQRTAIYFIGSLGSIINNQFVCRHTTLQTLCIHFDNSDTTYDSFSTDAIVGILVNSNLFDMRGTVSDSGSMLIDSGDLSGKFLSIVGNMQIGGQRFVNGGLAHSSIIGNIWGSSSGASGTSVNSRTPSISMGNIADSNIPSYVAADFSNQMTMVIPSVDSSVDSTPSVSGISKMLISGGATVTNFDDGRVGQEILLVGNGAGATIQHNTNVRLNGAVNFTLGARSTLSLIRMDSTTWVETARSSN